ncbi:hypothetical protein SUNI508_01258 [Seiridium unicorne]|uniref:Uncharacterized protein n=1 Tax=Seiridium unicorne TaxID=138068 RepID=A0ABR2UXH0_9PEZI
MDVTNPRIKEGDRYDLHHIGSFRLDRVSTTGLVGDDGPVLPPATSAA